MSRKSVKTKRIETAKSLATSFTTDWHTITQLDNVGMLIACNSVTDNTGVFSIEVRMQDSEGNSSEEASLTLSAVPTLADAAANFFIDLNQVPANQVRLKFTAAGGTPDGTAEIFFHTKSVGA